MTNPSRQFVRTIGMNYSGAETAEASLKGLRVYQTFGEGDAQEVLPPPGSKNYWTRRGLANWLAGELGGGVAMIVGIDHAFSFPMRCFERYRLEPDWNVFLVDFCALQSPPAFTRCEKVAGLGERALGCLHCLSSPACSEEHQKFHRSSGMTHVRRSIRPGRINMTLG